MPHTWLKGVPGGRRALKRACGAAARGAAPTQALRMVRKWAGEVDGEFSKVITMGGTSEASVMECVVRLVR